MRGKWLRMITPDRTRQVFSSRRLCAIVAMMGVLGVGGCGSSGPEAGNRDIGRTVASAEADEALAPFREQAEEVLSPRPRSRGGGAQGQGGSGGETVVRGDWSIVLVAMRGAEAGQTAALALEKVRRQGGLAEAYVERRGESVVVAYGRYDSPLSRAAQEDLARVRAMEVDGERPFAGAVLAPPPMEGLRGSIPEYDLAGVRESLNAGRAKLYTLQIGVYATDDGREPSSSELTRIRRAAEAAAVALRREGEEAYYFHGPRRSMVTIGVFAEQEIPASGRPMGSMRLREAQRKHPHNLVNGQGAMVRTAGQREGRLQESRVVEIP